MKITTILSVPFCPYHFVHTILSHTILSVYHFARTILSVPFCPVPFCPVTLFTIKAYLLIFVAHGGTLLELMPFGPEGRGFESRSSRHARDLGQVLRLQLPVAIRRANSDTVSIAVVGNGSE